MSTQVPQESFADELKVEGIDYKGYGKIFKLVMFDLELTIEAKAIYAYFCSYAGKGNQAFPGQQKILADLLIKSNSYYNHFQLLKSQGYIKVEHKYVKGKRARNVYILADKPSKYFEPAPNAKMEETYEKVRKSGIRSLGFGSVPKAVMQDSRISIKSKGIYAFLAALAGDSDHSYPKHDDLLYYLQISNPTFYKHYLPLMELNYITPIQKRESGAYTGTDFYINNFPDLEEAKHRRLRVKRKIKETQKNKAVNDDSTTSELYKSDVDGDENENGAIKPFSPIVKKPLVEKPLVEKPLVEKPEHKINRSKNKQCIQNQSVSQKDAEERKNENVSDLYSKNLPGIEKTKTTELSEKADSPPFGSYAQTVSAVHAATNFKEVTEEYSAVIITEEKKFTYNTFCLVNQALIDMLTTQKTMFLCKQNVTCEMVYERLKHLFEGGAGIGLTGNEREREQLSLYQAVPGCDPNGMVGFSMAELVGQAISGYQKGHQYNADQGTDIGFALQYMKACIWTAILTGKKPTSKPGSAVNNSTLDAARPNQKRSRFCNFEQRNIDYAKLERLELELFKESMKNGGKDYNEYDDNE